jgi:hypothetical protein
MPPAGSAEATYAASFQRMAELLLHPSVEVNEVVGGVLARAV